MSKSGVICKSKNKSSYIGEVIPLGDTPLEIGSNLFDALIEMDKKNIDIIYAEDFGYEGVYQAVMNRLLKASGYKTIIF